MVVKTSDPCLESVFREGLCGFVKSVTRIGVFSFGKAAKFVGAAPREWMDVTHRGMLWERSVPEGVGAESSIPTASKGNV